MSWNLSLKFFLVAQDTTQQKQRVVIEKRKKEADFQVAENGLGCVVFARKQRFGLCRFYYLNIRPWKSPKLQPDVFQTFGYLASPWIRRITFITCTSHSMTCSYLSISSHHNPIVHQEKNIFAVRRNVFAASKEFQKNVLHNRNLQL